MDVDDPATVAAKPAARRVKAAGGPQRELYTRFSHMVTNEIRAPELLPFKTQEVTHLMTLISEHEDLLMEGVSNEEEKILADVYQLDLERAKYYLQLYFRARLAKIDKYYLHILATPALKDRLSPKELEYAEKYKAIIEEHFRATVLDMLPAALRRMDENHKENDMIPKPNLRTPVFVRVGKEDLGFIGVNRTKSGRIRLRANSIHVLPYQTVAAFVCDTKFELL